MNQVRNIQWLNQNRYRAYPFIEDQIFPEWLDKGYFVDIKMISYTEPLYTHHSMSDGTNEHYKSVLKLSSIEKSMDTLTFSFLFGDTPVVVYSSPILLDQYTNFTATSDDYHINVVVSKDIMNLPSGIYFTEDLVIVEPALVLYRLNDRLSSVVGLNTDDETVCSKIFCETERCTRPGCDLASNSNNNGNTRKVMDGSLLSGDIYFEEGFGLKLIFDNDNNSITFDSSPGIGGEATAYSCVSFYFESPCGDYIYNLNGLRPNQQGKIELIGKNLTVELDKDNVNRLLLKTQVNASGNNCGINNSAV